MSHALTLITFVPLIGAAIILALPATMTPIYKWVAAISTVPQLIIAVWLYVQFDTTTTAVQFAERAPWMASYHINYFMGVDGISISMVLLTALICFISVFASFSVARAEKGYYALLLMLDTGMMGVFVSLDFFLFYIFWEVMLLPMYFLIGIWGGPRREYAAIKFFLYTLLGSVLILLAMLGLYYYGPTPTFDMTKLAANASGYSLNFQRVVWIALFIGFAIKIPAFPFHTWLPDAHVEAPTAISVILAGVLLKMGTYGILRVNFAILPAASHQLAWFFLGVIGAINIVYGAMCAMAQTDYKKLIAYSSISHMGYVMLGAASFTAAGINGAVLQMFNHGTITAMLFILVGVIYDRAHHRDIAGFGGLAQQMPVYAGMTGFAFFAGMGLPGMSAFISEVLVLIGAWQTHPILTIFAAATAILTAGYLLWTYQRIYLGPFNEKYKAFPDLSFREAFCLVPLAIIVLILGVYPHAILGLLNTSLVHLNQVVLAAPATAVAMLH
jgi:NADH-quinone oxidoreductase subunit M